MIPRLGMGKYKETYGSHLDWSVRIFLKMWIVLKEKEPTWKDTAKHLKTMSKNNDCNGLEHTLLHKLMTEKKDEYEGKILP